MKELKTFIIESIDDNLFWKIDKYFEKNNEEKQIFINLVDLCRTNNGFNEKTVEVYLNQHKDFKNKLNPFIDFLDDIISKNVDDTRNYIYLLYKVIRIIIGNKEDGEKYTNIE